VDINSAIQAHVNWKTKLAIYIARPDHSLKASEVSHHEQCELGRWLAGEGRKFAAMPEYTQLAADHARFHHAAAEVIRKADAGERVQEDIALGGKSEYAAASNAVVTSLMKIKAKIKSAA
jgi:hypothetical protein